MADPTTVTTPDFTGVVDPSYFLAPLGGPQHPQSYLDRFPEEVYNKGLDSHLVRFMYALLGPAGIGWLKKNYFEARLKLEEFGLETFDLDRFYGDPLTFGRILEEVYDEDPRGLLPRDKWEEIRAKDAAYRNRAIDYVNGARAGNTPLGMRLVARSGLGHEVEIVEQYKYIYDQLSDDTLGIPNYGFSNTTGEFIVIPRRELPQSEIQTLTINGSPTGGTFTLFFPVGDESSNSTQAINYDALPGVVQQLLEALPSIGAGNVVVSGGPLPDSPIEIRFTGDLAHGDVPKLQAVSSLTGGTAATIMVTTTQGGVDQSDEVVAISPRNQHYLHSAISRIKPVASIVTFGKGSGRARRQVWNNALSSSENHHVVRYVTGRIDVPWPTRDSINWIEAGVEHQAPRPHGDIQHHYRGFHNIATLHAYDDPAVAHDDYLTDLASVQAEIPTNAHVGRFSDYQRRLFPLLRSSLSDDTQFVADQAQADYAEPLTVRATTPDRQSTPLVNGMYPTEWRNLPGVPQVKYEDEQFWASKERVSGTDYLEIDLGSVRPVNYLYFEITRKPVDVALDFDLLDQSPERLWEPVTWEADIPSVTSVGYSPNAINPWQTVELFFETALRKMIFTRFLRLRLTRRGDNGSPFQTPDGYQYPFSIEVRNLRVARNVV